MSATSIAKRDLAMCEFEARANRKKKEVDKTDFIVCGFQGFYNRIFPTFKEACEYCDYLQEKFNDIQTLYIVRRTETLVYYSEEGREEN